MKRIKRWFWAWDIDKEKEFLEEKAEEGLILSDTKVSNYYFNETEPKKLKYEIDFRLGTDKISEEEYLQIFEDAGWKLAAKLSGWYYFYTEKDNEADHSIFNDNTSRAGIYKRLIFFLCLTGFPLYYQTLVMFPAISTQMDLKSFYGVMEILMAVIMIIHASALIRIIIEYKRIRKDIKE